jgi:tetratricopeptide (TPR) repeat protein
MTMLCPETKMEELTRALQEDSDDDLQRVDRLISDYPEDPRLHFLRGSILAGIGRSIEALGALRRAVEIAPDFAIARFQLGFFQLTSGEAADALSTWGPLALLPDSHYLRHFVAGLTRLIRDEFEETEKHLREGIAANDENPPLNRDMELILTQVREILAGSPAQLPPSDGASATSFLLDQLSNGRSGR